MSRFKRMEFPDPLPEGSYTRLTQGEPGDWIRHVLVARGPEGFEWSYPYPELIQVPVRVPPSSNAWE